MKKTNVLKLIVVSALAIIIAVASSSMSLGATYNYNATNILDNLSNDSELGLIIPIVPTNNVSARRGVITADALRNQFTAKGLTVKNISTGNTVGTGSRITVNQNNLTYTVLIYGDINGDGRVNGGDTSALIENNTTSNKLSGIKYRAADVSNSGSTSRLNGGDLSLLISFIVGDEGVSKCIIVAPTINPPDTTKPVINSTYSSKTINYGDAYNIMDGITATDNMDGTITNKVAVTIKYNNTTVSSFDSTKVGTYTLTYNVSDNAGNAATAVTRTVTVQDPVQSISVSGYKATYIYGDDFSAIGTISVTRSSGVSNVALSEAEISGYNKNQLGEQIITVTYGGKSTTFNVTVNDAVTGITVTAPTKVTYAYNEDIDLTGATYTTVMKSGAAGTTSDVTAAMISGYNKATVGEQTVTVTYEGKTATFTVTVKQSEIVTSIELAEIGETEIRKGTSTKKAIIVKNETDDEISVLARYLTITLTNNKVDAIFLTADDVPVNDENAEYAKYVMITPKSTSVENDTETLSISVDEAVATSNSIGTGNITFKINGEPVLAEIEEIDSITISRSGSVTVLPLVMKNQYGETMDYSSFVANDIGEYGLKIVIRSPFTENDSDKALTIACYDANNQVVTNTGKFSYIGISAALDENGNPFLLNDDIEEEDGTLKVKYKDTTNADTSFDITINLVD